MKTRLYFCRHLHSYAHGLQPIIMLVLDPIGITLVIDKLSLATSVLVQILITSLECCTLVLFCM
jgi:hypothetical protein